MFHMGFDAFSPRMPVADFPGGVVALLHGRWGRRPPISGAVIASVLLLFLSGCGATSVGEGMAVVRPRLDPDSLALTYETELAASPMAIFDAWTTDGIDRWFAAPGTVLMQPAVNAPYFFEARFDGQRHPHYGRFLQLELGRRIEMTWVTAMGTKGTETVLTIDLRPSGAGTRLRLTHAGFPDQASAVNDYGYYG